VFCTVSRVLLAIADDEQATFGIGRASAGADRRLRDAADPFRAAAVHLSLWAPQFPFGSGDSSG